VPRAWLASHSPLSFSPGFLSLIAVALVLFLTWCGGWRHDFLTAGRYPHEMLDV